MVNISREAFASNIVPLAYASQLSDVNGDGIRDTATIFFASILNKPDNIQNDNDKITFIIVGEVQPGGVGTQLTATSKLTQNNGSATITEPTHSLYLTLGQPDLSWVVTWTSTGDAGDIITCTAVAQQSASSTAIAYNLKFSVQLASSIDLITNSINSSRADASYSSSSDTQGTIGLVQVPTLSEGASTITVTFKVQVGETVPAGSTVANTLILNYTSASVGGRAVYLEIFLLPLFIMFNP